MFFHPSADGHRLLTVVTITSATNTNECRSKHLSTFNFQYLFFVFKKKKRSISPVHTRTPRRKGHPGVPSWPSQDTHDEDNQYQTLKKVGEKKFMILSTQPPEPRKWIRMMRSTQPMTPKGKGINKKVQEKE